MFFHDIVFQVVIALHFVSRYISEMHAASSFMVDVVEVKMFLGYIIAGRQEMWLVWPGKGEIWKRFVWTWPAFSPPSVGCWRWRQHVPWKFYPPPKQYGVATPNERVGTLTSWNLTSLKHGWTFSIVFLYYTYTTFWKQLVWKCCVEVCVCVKWNN
jgi:hypothetical protein